MKHTCNFTQPWKYFMKKVISKSRFYLKHFWKKKIFASSSMSKYWKTKTYFGKKCNIRTADVPALQSHNPGYLSQKNLKTWNSTKNLKILAGYFFDSDKFEEHSSEGFFTLNNIDERQKVIFICLKSKKNKKYFLFFDKTASIFKNWDIFFRKRK